MGTNYYVAKNRCECCNRYDEEYHIGKSSMGWAFSFQGYPWNKLTSWKQWKMFLKDQLINNSYREWETDRKSTRLNSSHSAKSRMPSSA